MHLVGVRLGTMAQNLVTAAKVLALVGVLVVAAVAGNGAGWTGSLPGAPTGAALFGAMAVAFQAVIWSYYGYPDAAKIAEEMKDPDRALPRVFIGGIASVTVLYLLLNAAFVHVLPFDRIAASTLVAGDAAAAMFGHRAGGGDVGARAPGRAGVAQRQPLRHPAGDLRARARRARARVCCPG